MSGVQITVEFLQDLFKDEYPDVLIQDFKIVPGASPGDNSSADVHRISITGTRCLNQKPWETSIIYKQLPKVLKSPVFIDLCANEAAFYNNTWPVLERFQRQFNLQHPFQALPKCYLAQPDAIFINDLKRDGFVMGNRRQGLTLKESYLTLKRLSHLHALSLCMKSQNPEGFQKLLTDSESIHEVLFVKGKFEVLEGLFTHTTENAMCCVEQELSGSEDRQVYLDKLQGFCEAERMYNIMLELVSPKEPLAVICHGDCWTSNLMYKCVVTQFNCTNHHNYFLFRETHSACFDIEHYGAARRLEPFMAPIKVLQNERTLSDSIVLNFFDMRMIDFQLVRYSSLAIDLIYILYLSIERELRLKHFDGLLKYYSEELRRRVSEMTTTEDSPLINTILDKAKLDKLLRDEMKRCLPYGLCVAFSLFPIMTLSPKDAVEPYKRPTNGVAANNKSSKFSDPMLPLSANREFRKKLTQLLRDLVDDGSL